MNRRIFFNIMYLCMFCTGIMTGCNQGEDAITPSDELPTKYHLPQGDAAYDDRILDFYNQYGTYLLYDYDTIDPFWNIQSTLGVNYRVILPRDEHVEAGVDCLFDLWLDLYSETFLEGRLPRYIFMADTIYNGKYTKTYTTTATNMTIAGINKSLSGMTASQVSKLKSAINNAYWEYIITRGKFEIPEAFKNIDYMAIKTLTAAYNAGLFHGSYSAKTVEDDFMKSINWLLTTSQISMDSRFKQYPACKERCTMLVDEMKRLHGLDLEILSERKLPHSEE